MKRLNGRKIVLWIMTLVLCVTTCMPAFASVGDRTLYKTGSDDGTSYESIVGAFQLKDGFCIISGSWEYTIQKYATPQSEPETFVTKNEYEEIEVLAGEQGEVEIPAAAEDGADLTGETAAPDTDTDKTETPVAPEESKETAEAPAVAEEKTETPAAQEDGEKEDDFFADMEWASSEEGEKTTAAPEANKEEADTSAAPEAAAIPEGIPAEDDFFSDVEWAEDENESWSYSSGDHVDTFFAWNGELYGIAYEQDPSDTGNYKVIGATIKHVKLENGEIILEDSNVPGLDMSSFADDQDFYNFQSVITSGNYLIASYYGATGEVLAVFDLTDGTYKELPQELAMQAYCAGPEGSLLIPKRGEPAPGSNTIDFEIVRVNLDNMEEESFGVLKDIYNYRLPMAYDQANDTVYYVDKGEIWAVQRQTGEAVSVNDCPLDAQNALLVDGFIVVWDYRTILMRNTDPSKRSSTTLRVSNTLYATDGLSNAILEMSNTRGDVSVILSEGMNQLNSGLLQAMMNQDGYNDIYILSYDSKDFQALRDRGYLTEISGNQQIDEYIERMYPYIANVTKHDGKLVAIPILMTGEGIGISMRAWKKLGGTEEELPKTWNQFFDWVTNDVQERAAGTDVQVCTYTKQSILSMVKNTMLTQYQAWLNSKGGELIFNAPELKEPMKKLDDLDWAALGINEDEDSFGGGWSSDNPPLLDIYQQPYYTTWDGGFKYLELGFEEGKDPVIPVEIYVAVINPFSKHQEEAKEYLALVLKNLDIATQYSFFADKTEPVEQANAADWVNTIAENIEQLNEQLKTAEGDIKSSLEAELENWEGYREEAEEYRWTISPSAIEAYQKRVPHMMVLDYYFMYDIYNPDDPEEVRKLYDDIFGEGNVEEALDMIDKKINTIRKEGN